MKTRTVVWIIPMLLIISCASFGQDPITPEDPQIAPPELGVTLTLDDIRSRDANFRRSEEIIMQEIATLNQEIATREINRERIRGIRLFLAELEKEALELAEEKLESMKEDALETLVDGTEKILDNLNGGINDIIEDLEKE